MSKQAILSPIILFLLSLAITVHAELSYKSDSASDADLFVYTVQYVYEGEEIKFAVFHRNYREAGLKCLVVYESKVGKMVPIRATLKLNDKTEKDLLKEGGIYRVDNGVVQKVDLKFKATELQAFLKENRFNITIDEFVAYLKKKNV